MRLLGKLGVCLSATAFMLGAVAMTSTGCKAEKHKVDYGGEIRKSCYTGAKDEYETGERVVLRYEVIATDTDYHFELEGADLNVRYDNGYVLSFTMPDHDVKLTLTTRNLMVDPKWLEEQERREKEALERAEKEAEDNQAAEDKK